MPEKDKRLMIGVRKGEPRSFDTLYERYKQPIFNYLYQMMGDAEEAKDLTQESFVVMFGILAEGKKIDNLKAYLYKVARNRALRKLEHRSKECLGDELMDRLPDEGYYSDPARAARNRKQQLDIMRALRLMPEKYREILILREQAGFSYERIAGMLDTNKTNVGVMVYRARARFRQLYRMLQVTGKPASAECEKMLPLISSWIDGETTRKQEKEIQAHMADCPFCRLASEQMVDAHSTFHSLIPLFIPAAAKATLMAKLGLAGTVPISLAAGGAAGTGAAAVGASLAASGTGASAAIAGAGGSTAVSMGAALGATGATTGLTAKATGVILTVVIALAAVGGGTYVGVREAVKKTPAEMAQVLEGQIREFLAGTRNTVDIPGALRKKAEDLWQASREFVEEHMPEYSVEQMSLEAENAVKAVVDMTGVRSSSVAVATEDQVGEPEGMQCYLQLARERGSYSVEKLLRHKHEL